MLDLFGSPNQPWVNGGTKTVVVNQTIGGGDVDYWYQEAQRLRREYSALIEVNTEIKKENLKNLRDAMERRANDAALRAVIRHVLHEIAKSDPGNMLLNKKNRDEIFQEYRTAAIKRLVSSRSMKAWPDQNPKEASTANETSILAIPDKYLDVIKQNTREK